MLQSQYPIPRQHREVIDGLTDQSGRADVIFITAASANHYGEVQGVLKGLQTLIFPKLRKDARFTFKLLCYDLGFQPEQVRMVSVCVLLQVF